MHGHDLPKYPRTLLQTPRNNSIKRLLHGNYMHYGVLNNIEKQFTGKQNIPNTLKLNYR